MSKDCGCVNCKSYELEKKLIIKVDKKNLKPGNSDKDFHLIKSDRPCSVFLEVCTDCSTNYISYIDPNKKDNNNNGKTRMSATEFLSANPDYTNNQKWSYYDPYCGRSDVDALNFKKQIYLKWKWYDFNGVIHEEGKYPIKFLIFKDGTEKISYPVMPFVDTMGMNGDSPEYWEVNSKDFNINYSDEFCGRYRTRKEKETFDEYILSTGENPAAYHRAIDEHAELEQQETLNLYKEVLDFMKNNGEQKTQKINERLEEQESKFRLIDNPSNGSEWIFNSLHDRRHNTDRRKLLSLHSSNMNSMKDK